MIGVKFDSGVLIAADDLVSYGSMARFRNQPRVMKVNSTTIAGCGGDYADFQYLSNLITQKQIGEECHADGHTLTPKALYNWITRVLYQKRSKFDPLWTTWIVAGMNEEDGKPFLGLVDKLGTAYQDNAIATGYGAYIATPLLREWTENKSLTEADARIVIANAMKVLYARDARSSPKYQIAVVKSGAEAVVEPVVKIDADWSIADYSSIY